MPEITYLNSENANVVVALQPFSRVKKPLVIGAVRSSLTLRHLLAQQSELNILRLLDHVPGCNVSNLDILVFPIDVQLCVVGLREVLKTRSHAAGIVLFAVLGMCCLNATRASLTISQSGNRIKQVYRVKRNILQSLTQMIIYHYLRIAFPFKLSNCG